MERCILLEEAANSAARKLGYPLGLKEEQLQVVVAFLLGRDVFAVLPTGFGKSLCYACLPYAFQEVESLDERPIVVVVTPLTSIMKDQAESFRKRGLDVAYVTSEAGNEEMKRGVCEGKYQLVFFTPELLLDCKRWRRVLSGGVYSARLKGFVIDEAHCIAKWGDTFRTSLRRIGEVRSLLPGGMNIMALTATAVKTLRVTVSRTIGLQNPFVISLCPCQRNLVYAVGKFNSTVDSCLEPVICRLKDKRSKLPRVIIYCRTLQDCSDIYISFRNSLGIHFTEPPGAPDITRFRLVEMYTSVTDCSIKDDIIRLFTMDSQLRVVIATVAFGMGVDCRDVREVIHLGAPDDLESYIQETGRAGRDGVASLAMLMVNGSKRSMTEPIIDYVENDTICRRDFLFRDMESYQHLDLGSKCMCCDVCARKCECGSCVDKGNLFIYL